MTRSANDWGALALAEIRGDEQPGTVARLVAETTGRAPVADTGGEVKSLLRLLELLHHPGDLKKKIADLDRSASAATTAAQSAKAEQTKLARAKQDLAAERSKHEAAIARDLSEHKAVLAAANAELAFVKKQAADLKAQAEADAQKAAELKTELARRMRFAETGAAA